MKSPIRLLATVAPDGESIDFDALFAVPAADQPEVCAPADLHTGDGDVIELGLRCSPTPFTWRSQQRVKLGSHRYRDGEAHTASLHWGETTAEVTVAPEMLARDIAGQPAIERPTVTLFAVNVVTDSPHERRAKLEVAGLSPSQRVRLDGGAGQAFWLSCAETPSLAGEWRLDYPKPGGYTVAVDLVDADGFWLATLAEMPIEIAPPLDLGAPAMLRPAEAEFVAEPLPESAQPTVTGQPWLPYRNCRPTWGSTPLYTQAGGGYRLTHGVVRHLSVDPRRDGGGRATLVSDGGRRLGGGEQRDHHGAV